MINAYGMNDYGIPIIGTMNDIDATTKKILEIGMIDIINQRMRL